MVFDLSGVRAVKCKNRLSKRIKKRQLKKNLARCGVSIGCTSMYPDKYSEHREWLESLIDSNKANNPKFANDCDGFNHPITKILIKKVRVGRKGWYLTDVCGIKENGYYFCGFNEPWTVAEIEDYMKESITEEGMENSEKLGWNETENREILTDLTAHKRICDDNGVKL